MRAPVPLQAVDPGVRQGEPTPAMSRPQEASESLGVNQTDTHAAYPITFPDPVMDYGNFDYDAGRWVWDSNSGQYLAEPGTSSRTVPFM